MLPLQIPKPTKIQVKIGQLILSPLLSNDLREIEHTRKIQKQSVGNFSYKPQQSIQTDLMLRARLPCLGNILNSSLHHHLYFYVYLQTTISLLWSSAADDTSGRPALHTPTPDTTVRYIHCVHRLSKHPVPMMRSSRSLRRWKETTTTRTSGAGEFPTLAMGKCRT